MNSCNPVFVTVGLRMGADTFYQSMKQFGLLNRTGIDVPGEAGTIMHAQDFVRAVLSDHADPACSDGQLPH